MKSKTKNWNKNIPWEINYIYVCGYGKSVWPLFCHFFLECVGLITGSQFADRPFYRFPTCHGAFIAYVRQLVDHKFDYKNIMHYRVLEIKAWSERPPYKDL